MCTECFTPSAPIINICAIHIEMWQKLFTEVLQEVILFGNAISISSMALPDMQTRHME